MTEAPASPASSAALATSSLLLGKLGWLGTGEAPVTAQVMMTLSCTGTLAADAGAV